MLFLFKSTHTVIKAEKCCHQQGIMCNIVPIPRSISTECGMGIEVKKEQVENIITLLKKNKITYTTYNYNEK